MNELTLIDLFSGIGGFSLAGDLAGFRTVCFSEVDPYASAVLRKHWPDVPNLGDITKADFSPFTGATVLTGGFPCQPFSVAGKRRGKDDDRYLWPAMLEVIAAVKPTWIVGENVTGIASMALKQVCFDLESLNFEVWPLFIPACAIGAPQRRERVWLLSHSMRRNRPLGRIVSGSRREQKQMAWDSLGTREGEPELVGMADGLSSRVDRLKCLGNSIVPQVAEQILRGIAVIERGE